MHSEQAQGGRGAILLLLQGRVLGYEKKKPRTRLVPMDTTEAT